MTLRRSYPKPGSRRRVAQGYDIVILSDLLHFHASHTALIYSLTSLLSRSRHSQVYVAAGNYTPKDVCNNFLREAERSGIVWEARDNTGPAEAQWLGTMPVPGLSKSQLAARKNVCLWWVGRWAEPEE